MGGTCSAHRGDEKCEQNLVVNPEVQRPLGRTIRRWEDNIKINFNK
jgi:hypothetical protein